MTILATVNHPNRLFKLWAYSVSHRTMLLRSEPGSSSPGDLTIDIQFSDVTYLQISTVLRGVEIHELRSSDEGVDYPEFVPNVAGTTVFEILSGGHSYYVGAGSMSTAASEVERFEPGPLWPFPGSLSPFT